ncbi:MAG: zinc ribbon domain-containing protein [Deltaproteobacteria bacterium]|jgi:putative FmdB family regulatory protein|nr:zinc ribbon domain-containing protein [Deltaproteobacteria bacterium]
MPLYEYECQNCHQVTEALQKFSDLPLSVCPKCGGQLSKLMSLNSFSLKGSGWYATDYAAKPSPDKVGSDKNTGDGAKKADSKAGISAPAAVPPTTKA